MTNERMTNDEKISRLKRRKGEKIFHFSLTSIPLRHSSFVIRYFRLRSRDRDLRRASPNGQRDPCLGSPRPSSAQQIDLQGQLREKESDSISCRQGRVIRYTFSNPNEALQLRLGENDSRLEEGTRAPRRKSARRVRSQSAGHECHLRGPRAEISLLAKRPRNRRGRYPHAQLLETGIEGAVAPVAILERVLRVDKEGGVLMRMEGYDWNGRLAKRFEVVSAQKIEGRWFLKQMRIEEILPGTNHIEGRAYLEIKR